MWQWPTVASSRYPSSTGSSLSTESPHIHLAVLSMVTTATVIYALEPGSSTPTANSFTPLGPQSFAVLSCAPEASVRVFLVPKRTMTILKGGPSHSLTRVSACPQQFQRTTQSG